MINIKYNNTENFIPVSFARGGNTVTLSFPRYEDKDGNVTITSHAPNTNGFKTYRTNGAYLGDWSDFTTVYRVTDDSITYSNDGSVWTEPVEYEPPKPTYEELVVQKIRLRYDLNSELSILRQRDTKPQEFAEYNSYCEACKAEAREELNL